MSKPNEQYAYFSLTGSFDPSEVTGALGVEPTDSWKQGDLHPFTQHERKFSRWSLRSRLTEDQQLELHIQDVLNQLDQCPGSVASVISAHGAWIQLVAYFHEQFHGLTLDRELIKRLSQYGLSIDCDFYYLWSDSRENT